MPVAEALGKIDRVRAWLNRIDDSWIIVQSTETGGAEITPSQVMDLAEKKEWAELDDQSDLLYARQGYLYPEGIILGTGDPAKAYRKEVGHTAIFINAYEKGKYCRRRNAVMEISTRVRQWIDETEGYNRLIAVSSGSKPISPAEILRLASRHDARYASISSANDNTPNMHSKSLQIAWNAPDNSVGYHLIVAVRSSDLLDPS